MTEAINHVYETFLIYVFIGPSQRVVGRSTFHECGQVEVGPGLGDCKRSGTYRENLTVKLADVSGITVNGSLVPSVSQWPPKWP